jgi:hypothetical protein
MKRAAQSALDRVVCADRTFGSIIQQEGPEEDFLPIHDLSAIRSAPRALDALAILECADVR